MSPDEPVYQICQAYSSVRVASVFGFDGLLETVPLLPPDLYRLLEGRDEVGWADVSADGSWWLEVRGMRAGPGYVIV